MSLEGDIESSTFDYCYQTPRHPPFPPPILPSNVVRNPTSFGNNPQVPPVTMMPLPGMAGMPAFKSNLLDPLPVAGIPLKDTSEDLPHPISRSSVIVYEIQQRKLVKPPPPVTSKYIVKDTGNCSPRYMRGTLNQIPCTGDLLKLSRMPLALIVQPLALLDPPEDPIQVVDFGESGPVRCYCCRGYMNPFMEFIDHGNSFICNFCGIKNETPLEYFSYLGLDGRHLDADERPELCRGTVEFCASGEFMMRDMMPPVYFFLIDVARDAVQAGATAAACAAIRQVILDLPEGRWTMVGIATYDSTIQFYNLKPTIQEPLMLVVADTEDVYSPFENDVIINLSECRQNLEHLLENIPTMFQGNNVADSAFGAAIKSGCFLSNEEYWGKTSSISLSIAINWHRKSYCMQNEETLSISSVEKSNHNLLQPEDKILSEMAIEFGDYQVCVDIFVTTQTYVGIASITVISKTTGGQVDFLELGTRIALCCSF